MKSLLAAGAKVAVVDEDDEDPITAAGMWGFNEVLELLYRALEAETATGPHL